MFGGGCRRYCGELSVESWAWWRPLVFSNNSRAHDFLIATPLALLRHVHVLRNKVHPPTPRLSPTTCLPAPPPLPLLCESYTVVEFLAVCLCTYTRGFDWMVPLDVTSYSHPLTRPAAAALAHTLPCCFSTAPPCSNASPPLAWILYEPGKGPAVVSRSTEWFDKRPPGI